MNAMPNSGVARLTIGIDTNAAITSPAVKMVAAFCLRMALASAGVRNRIAASSKHSRPNIQAVAMKHTIPDCGQHLDGRVQHDGPPLVRKPPREVAIPAGFGKSRGRADELYVMPT